MTFKCKSSHTLTLPLREDAIVCVQGTRTILQEFFSLKIETPFTLVTIESDEATPQDNEWLKHKHLNAWFGWNSVHPGVIPIPKGLDHDTQLHPMLNATARKHKREKLLVSFLQYNDERRSLYKQVKNLSYVRVKLPYSPALHQPGRLKRYFEEMSAYKWILCPSGTGQDVLGVWEALYVGSIPVILKSSISSVYDGLPVLQLNSWTELSISTLRERSWEPKGPRDLQTAYLEHWKTKIHKIANKGSRQRMSELCIDPPSYLQSVFQTSESLSSENQSMHADSSCIITGFDKSHEKEGMLMVLKTVKACYNTRLLVYDMGMTASALTTLSTKGVVEIYNSPSIMPEFASQFERGSTAFKPLVIADAIMTKGCSRGLWGDASVRPRNHLCQSGNLPRFPVSLHRRPQKGQLFNREWTHPDTYKYFLTSRQADHTEQWEANTILFDMSTPIWPGVLCRWLYCALHELCILPDGAIMKGKIPNNRKKIDGVLHNDDQSALNLALLDTLMLLNVSWENSIRDNSKLVAVNRDHRITGNQTIELIDTLTSLSRPMGGHKEVPRLAPRTLELM